MATTHNIQNFINALLREQGEIANKMGGNFAKAQVGAAGSQAGMSSVMSGMMAGGGGSLPVPGTGASPEDAREEGYPAGYYYFGQDDDGIIRPLSIPIRIEDGKPAPWIMPHVPIFFDPKQYSLPLPKWIRERTKPPTV